MKVNLSSNFFACKSEVIENIYFQDCLIHTCSIEVCRLYFWWWIVGIADEYQPPYFETIPVNTEPTYEAMKKIVCVDKMRPGFPNRWSSNEVRNVHNWCKECESWH